MRVDLALRTEKPGKWPRHAQTAVLWRGYLRDFCISRTERDRCGLHEATKISWTRLFPSGEGHQHRSDSAGLVAVRRAPAGRNPGKGARGSGIISPNPKTQLKLLGPLPSIAFELKSPRELSECFQSLDLLADLAMLDVQVSCFLAPCVG